jgi:hypothetical protein
MTTAHATSSITVALFRTLAGLSVVEACSIGQGVFGSPVSAAEEARELQARRGVDESPASASASGSAAAWRGNTRCESCSHAPFVLKQVERMYLTGGVDANAFASSVVFEDPAALVEGIDEVTEAFRAVQAFAPTKARESSIERIGDDTYVVNTVMRYKLPLTGPEGITVRSEVVVDLVPKKKDGILNDAADERVSIEPQQHSPMESGKICRIEERWNGAKLLEGFPFDLIRRGTGLVSYAATKAVV